MSLPNWLHWCSTCPSTNTWALEHLAELHHGSVVYTPQQTSGRGQWGRTWLSPPGVLTATYVLDGIAAANLPYLSLLAGLAVVRTLTEIAPELDAKLQIKWPNDLWLCDRKLAGILTEAPQQYDAGSIIVVGIGLNREVDFSQSELSNRAISLHDVVVDVPDVQQLLAAIRTQLLQLAIDLRGLPSNALLPPRWVRAINQRDILRDRWVTVKIGSEEISGYGLGVDWQGRYQLRSPSGTVRPLTTGQIQSW